MSTSIAEPVVQVEGLAEPSEVTQKIEESVEQIGADKILGEIRKNCFILYVTVRAWRGQYQLHNAQVLLDGKKVSDDLTTKPSSKLVPKKWHETLQKFESRTRGLVRRLAVPFKDGVYVVPKARAKVLVDTVKAIREEYRQQVEAFQAEWPEIVAALQERFTAEHGEDQWAALSQALPDAQRLGKLFDIEIGLWPVASGGGLPAECFDDLQRAANEIDAVRRLAGAVARQMDAADAELLLSFAQNVEAAHAKARRGVGKMIEEDADEYLEEARQATGRMVAAAVEAMVTEPVREFAEQIENLLKVSDTGTARNQTLDAVRRAHQKLEGFAFMLPSELLGRLKQVQVRLGAADARSVNVNSRTAAGAGLREALAALHADLTSDANQLNTFGQFARNLDI